MLDALCTHLRRSSAGRDAPASLEINQRREHEGSVESLKACLFVFAYLQICKHDWKGKMRRSVLSTLEIGRPLLLIRRPLLQDTILKCTFDTLQIRRQKVLNSVYGKHKLCTW